jgi:adenylate kinase
MFRSAISAGTPLGIEAKDYMDKGLLVPDEITVGIIKDRISQPDCRQGFLLDGFPRNVAQAEALEIMLANIESDLDAVINIQAPMEILVSRLTGRRMCRSCGSIYHMEYNPPSAENLCDNCGGGLYQRSDDQEEAVKQRLIVYEERTSPLIEYYRNKGILHTIDGDKPIKDVLAALGKIFAEDWT